MAENRVVNRWFLRALAVVVFSVAVVIWLPTRCLHDAGGCDDGQVVMTVVGAAALVSAVVLSFVGFMRSTK
jgi:hypothetical protein